MFDFIVLVSALFAMGVIYGAVIMFLTFLEKGGMCQNHERLCEKDEKERHRHL